MQAEDETQAALAVSMISMKSHALLSHISRSFTSKIRNFASERNYKSCMISWIRSIFRKEQKENIPSDQKFEGIHADAEEAFDVNAVVARMLRGLQINWTSSPINANGRDLDYKYVFQHGEFHLVVLPKVRRGHLHFLFFHEADMGDLPKVQMACNIINQRIPEMKVVYSPHPEKNKLHIHLITWIRFAPWSKWQQEDFAEIMMRCFETAREFRTVLDDILKDVHENPEEAVAARGREKWLAAELEMSRQTVDWRLHDSKGLMLSDVISIVTERASFQIKRVKAVTDSMTIIEREEDISNCNLVSFLTDSSTMDGFARDQATFIVDVYHDYRDQTIVIHLAAESESENALYMRLTLMQPDMPAAPSNTLLPADSDKARTTQWLVSWSRRNNRENQAEFEYMWHEAQRQRENGQDLTQEGLFLMLSGEGAAGYNLYWGRRYYLEGRHYEALLHLENAIGLLHQQVNGMTKEERDTFQEVLYYAGLCCLQLDMPRRAYYYLDSIGTRKSLRYSKALVTALVKSRDYRATEIIDQSYTNLSKVVESQEIPEDKREEIVSFLLFLRRAKARVLTEDGQLDEAEKLLREMLQEDKPHERYILELLAKIAKIRLSQAPQPERSTISVSTEFPRSVE